MPDDRAPHDMPRRTRNILFIMCDQLRWDYLSCDGHPKLHTPNIDALAARGVRFTRAYVQSPVCGASRMSFYTGRYVQSHGAAWNGFPLKVGEMTLGDYLRPLGRATRCWSARRTCAPTRRAWSGSASIPTRSSACASPNAASTPTSATTACTRSVPTGATIRRSRATTAISTTRATPATTPGTTGPTRPQGEGNRWPPAGPCATRASRRACEEEDSETPYMTRRAMDFIAEAGDEPWCLHLSYIKPHWPYIAPAPYNDMYGPDDVLPAVRSRGGARRSRIRSIASSCASASARTFARDEVRDEVDPGLHGPHQADRRSAGRCCSASCRSAGSSTTR